MPKPVVIMVAMEAEIQPLLRRWRDEGKKIERGKCGSAKSLRCEHVTLLVAGIGRERARLAAESAIQSLEAALIISAGLAGAAKPGLKIGDVIRPAKVIDAISGQVHPIVNGVRGVLATAGCVLSRAEKAKLAVQYSADAIDMEAAAVAAEAERAGVPFLAVKTISDTLDFPMPPLGQFISNGRVRLLELMVWASVRPAMWGTLNRLRKNSRVAAEALAGELEGICDF